MNYHPHLTIALAEDRIAEHRRWAERQHQVNSARPSRRNQLFDTLARRLHRPVRSWESSSVTSQLTPAA